jgi:hypothetical protein
MRKDKKRISKKPAARKAARPGLDKRETKRSLLERAAQVFGFDAGNNCRGSLSGIRSCFEGRCVATLGGRRADARARHLLGRRRDGFTRLRCYRGAGAAAIASSGRAAAITAALVVMESSLQTIQKLGTFASASIARGGSADGGAFGRADGLGGAYGFGRAYGRAFRGRAGVAAVIVLEHATQFVKQLGAAVTTRVTSATSSATTGAGRRGRHSRSIAGKPGSRHQQERSIHEVYLQKV